MADGPYATVGEYRIDTGDATSADARVEALLAQQSAKLRALAGIAPGRELTADQLSLARALVTDAVRKALVPPSFEGAGEVTGATQASFSANGFSSSVQFSNPSGSSYFDRSTLSALRRLLGTSQAAGVVPVSYGALS